MKYIVAGDYQQYRFYCRENRLNPYCDATFVRDAPGGETVFSGTWKPEVIFYGTWKRRTRLVELEFALAARDARIIYDAS